MLMPLMFNITVKTKFSNELLVSSQGRENNKWRQLIKVTHIHRNTEKPCSC